MTEPNGSPQSFPLPELTKVGLRLWNIPEPWDISSVRLMDQLVALEMIKCHIATFVEEYHPDVVGLNDDPQAVSRRLLEVLLPLWKALLPPPSVRHTPERAIAPPPPPKVTRGRKPDAPYTAQALIEAILKHGRGLIDDDIDPTQEHMAPRLNMGVSTLQYWLEKFGLSYVTLKRQMLWKRRL